MSDPQQQEYLVRDRLGPSTDEEDGRDDMSNREIGVFVVGV